MSARVRPLTPLELDDAQQALYSAIVGGPRGRGVQHFPLTSADGALRGPFDGFLRSPAVGSALQEVGASIRYRTGLGDRSREIAILLVAARTGSAFERESHEAIGRAAGLSGDELAALRREEVEVFDGDEGVLARTVIGLLDGDLDDTAWDEASVTVGVDGVFELIALVGYYSTLALQLRVFRAEA